MREERIAAKLVEEAVTGSLSYWWLSFADSERPEGSQFLGVCIVQAKGITSAIRLTHTLGINPGGEVAGFELPDMPESIDKVKDHTNLLLSKEELVKRGLL